MNELGRRGSKKRKGETEKHLKQGTLFDHFVVTRKPSPAPSLARPDDPKDDGLDAQIVVERTGTDHCSGSPQPMEPSSTKITADNNDISLSPYDSSSNIQNNADVNIGQIQGSCSLDQEHITPPSSCGVSSAIDSPVDVDLVTGSNSPEFGPGFSASNPYSPRKDSSHVIDLTLDEGMEDAPILIKGSPVRAMPYPTLAPPSHVPVPVPPLLLGRRKQLKNKTSPDAPFPDASMQHVRDSEMSVQATPIDLARRQRCTSKRSPAFMSLKQMPTADETAKEHVRYHRRVPHSERHTDANTVLSCHGDLHPAISSIFGLASELQGVKETSQQHWNHKWRPRRAEHVLGNEQNACYLREWMHALRLHFDASSSSRTKMTKSKRNHKKRKRGEQRPTVVREVTRKRQRAGVLDGWMVDDDDDDDDDDINEDHETSEGISGCSLSSQDLREPLNISFGRQIRNTILLVGPPGCGKTAAVYACVEELGWNVFEVYPGVGKRGGTHLDDLIGDVGKNHTLPQPLLFHRGRSEPPSPVRKRSKNGVDTSDKLAEAEIHPQSVVLIEEADVVFTDEAGFWPSVVAFIKNCRRPVIITCNDASLIPVETLPLQATLTFGPPSTPLALSLLGAICQVEGRPTAKPEEIPDNCLEGQASMTDLRRCISQRQLGIADPGCQSPGQQAGRATDMIFALRVKHETRTKMEPELDERNNLRLLLQSLKGTDSASQLDAWALLSQPHDFEMAEDHPDDQVGYRALKITQRLRMPVHPENYCRDIDIATEALRTFNGVLSRCFPHIPVVDTREITPWPSSEQYRNRLWEGLKGDATLGSMVDLPRLYLDYRPLIGWMVREEDKEIERAAERAKMRGGRLTQNSQKRQEEGVRWLCATEELRGAVRAGGLCSMW